MRQSAKHEFIKTETWNTKELPEGSTLEGRYISCERFKGKFGDSVKYIVKDNNDVLWGIYGSATLNRQFDLVPVNSRVWVTYKGVDTTKNGREIKLYEVDYDTEG